MGRRYREMEILGASREMLVVKMYEGAIRFTRLARQHHDRGAMGDRGIAISRALAIVQELRVSLDHEIGGEITANLDALYDFAIDRLLEANTRGRADALDEVLIVLSRLSEAWVEIARNPPPVSGNAAPPRSP